MPERPNKLSLFWEELKRRNVHRSVAIYAGSAFVFLEAATIIFPRWGFPDWSIDLVLYLLILGAFITIIVSWIFDITPQGVQKTKPLEEITETEKQADSKVWKAATYISLVIIIGLITFNIMGGPKQLRAGDIQSLVILPFENYTGDDQLENMVSSMHSLLIGDMGRISGLRVIGKTSSKIYKDAKMSAKDIARELNVDAVVEGTVMCLGDSVCMQFRLVNTKGEEYQIWIGDYHEDKGKVLNLYNDITRQIANEVRVELTPEEERLLARKQTIDKDAFDAYLSSYAHWDDLSEESTRLAIDYLNKAVEKDPNWAPPWAGLAQLYGIRLQMGFEAPETAIPQTFAYLDKAVELDPNYADIHFNQAVFGTWLEWDWEKGEKEFLEALAINPNDVMSRIYYAHLLNILQRNKEAEVQGKIAAQLDPMNPLVQALYASVFIHLGSYDSAMVYLDKALALDPDHYFANGGLIMAGYHLGEHERVFEGLGKTNTLKEEFMDSVKAVYRDQGFIIAYSKVVEQLDQLVIVQPVRLALWNAFLHRYDIVLDLLEKGYEVHDPNMPYIASKGHGFRDSLSGNPRFIAICEKMNLPLPKD